MTETQKRPLGYQPTDALGAAVDAAVRGDVEIRVYKPWYSGRCGPGPECRDGTSANKVGEPIRRCLREAVNGAKASRQIVPCACLCHHQDGQQG